MKILIKSPGESAVSLLRRAGYAFQREEHGEQSFVRVLARAGYPRFHSYVKNTGNDILINFHLDQKRHTYGHETRHHGEYENEGALREEGTRLLRSFGEKATLVQ